MIAQSKHRIPFAFVTAPRIRKCVILIDGLNSPHGTEMLAMLVASSLRKLAWEVTIHTGLYTRKRSAWAALLKAHGIKVHHPGFWFLNRFYLPYRVAVRRFWSWCKKHQPDVIWSPSNDMLTCLALKERPLSSAPFFVHDPSEAANCPNYPDLWYQVCNRISALSVHGEKQRVGAVTEYNLTCPVEVIYPASSRPVQFSGLGEVETKIRFGQFGRMFSMKGTLFAVAAFAQVLSRGIDAQLHFFGDGPFRAATQELASSLGIQDRVFMHGSYVHTDLDRLVSTIDVGIMPSIYEGFGLVMLELMSRGRPVIASDVGSSREVLEKLDAGLVVPRADTAALAEAMHIMATNPGRLREMGANAEAAWKIHFTPEAMTERYISFWKHHGANL